MNAWYVSLKSYGVIVLAVVFLAVGASYLRSLIGKVKRHQVQIKEFEKFGEFEKFEKFKDFEMFLKI